jgi:hypothetical protein
VSGHFTILWKSRSTSTLSGQLAREAAEYIYSARAEIVNHKTRTFNITDTSDYIAPYSLFTSENISLAYKESSLTFAMRYIHIAV